MTTTQTDQKTYRVALVPGEVAVGESNPHTLQGIQYKGESEWVRIGAARLVALGVAKYGLNAIVVDDDDVVVYCA